MRAGSPGSFALSLAIHGIAAGLVLLLSLAFTRRDPPKPPMTFVLVAGDPVAGGATEAPAASEPLELNVPEVTLPEEPAPAPVPPPQEVAPPRPREVPEPAPAPPREVAKPAPKPKPKPEERKPEPRKEPAKQLSYEQFVKKYGKPQAAKPAPPRPVRTPRIDVGGVVGGSRSNTRGGEGGTAVSRAEQSLLENYIAQLIQALRLAHEKPPGLGDGLVVEVTFHIASNGEISAARVTRSSGDPAFDQSALDAFRRVRSIGPTPNGKSDTWTLNFRSKDEV